MALLFFNNNNAMAINTNYPKTEQEKKLEEMGSLEEKEGLTFKPRTIKTKPIKIPTNLDNNYLWQAAIEVLNFVPLASTDSSGGMIITEWYSPKDNKNFRYKINIFIKDKAINSEVIQVRVFEQNLKNGNWINNPPSSNMNLDIKDKILKKAKELHILSEKK